MSQLQDKGLLDKASYEYLATDIAEMLILLDQNSCLDEETFTALSTCLATQQDRFFQLLHGARHLQMHEMLNKVYFKLLSQTPSIEFAEGIAILNQGHMLINDTNIALLIQASQHAGRLAKGMVLLQQKGLLNKANTEFLVQHPNDASDLATGLILLHKANILDEVNRVLLGTCVHVNIHSTDGYHRIDDNLVNTMQILYKAKLLNNSNFNTLIKYLDYNGFIHHSLNQAMIFPFDPLKLQAVFFPYLAGFKEAISNLSLKTTARGIDQTVFNKIIETMKVVHQQKSLSLPANNEARVCANSSLWANKNGGTFFVVPDEKAANKEELSLLSLTEDLSLLSMTATS